jgi:uncharacterized protein YeaO (DUF488 family)
MPLTIKRVYEPAADTDGTRFFVERLWPRGIHKDALAMEAWLKEVSPSPALRQWYGHRPELWPEFKQRYFAEHDGNPDAWQPIAKAAREGNVTLLYSARDTERNSALALKEYLERRAGS